MRGVALVVSSRTVMEKAVFFIKVWTRSFSKMQKTDSGILWTAFVVKIAPGGRDGKRNDEQSDPGGCPVGDTRGRQADVDRAAKKERDRERQRERGDKRKKERERKKRENRKLHRPDAKCRVNVIHARVPVTQAQKKSPSSATHSFRENCTVYSALSGCPAACPIAPSELRVRNKSWQRLLLFTRCVRAPRYVLRPAIAVTAVLNTSIARLTATKPNFFPREPHE